MAYGTMSVYSTLLSQDMTVDFILPDTRKKAEGWSEWKDKKLPSIMVLHGYGDSHDAWIRKSVLELYARQAEVALFMPACGKEFYTDSKRNNNYFSYVTQELPMILRNYFPISDRREDNFIMGNSMGGYGAVKCALTYPQNYAAAASFSGALDLVSMMPESLSLQLTEIEVDLISVFGSVAELKDSPNDLVKLIKDTVTNEQKIPLRIYQCCGTEDFLLTQNQRIKRCFENYVNNISFVYHEEKGGHDWFYWNKEIYNVLTFFGFKVNQT